MTTDILSGDQPQGTSQAARLSGADALAQLVGEGKPFKSVEDMALGKLAADEFIGTLKGENKEMRDALGAASTTTETNKLLQDLLAKVGQASNGEGDGNQSVAGQGAPSREDIVKLIQGEVSERETQRSKEANRFKANSELLKHFNGDENRARAFVTMRASELGVTVKGLGTMAETTPQVFLELMGVVKPRIGSPSAMHQGGLPLDNARNPGDGSGGDGVVRDYAFYKELRKKLGDKYYQPKIQQQLIKDRKALGDKFFDKQS